MGNIEDAKVALDVIARAIDDAVYLDEDAYNQMLPLQQYTRTIEVRLWKISADVVIDPVQAGHVMHCSQTKA